MADQIPTSERQLSLDEMEKIRVEADQRERETIIVALSSLNGRVTAIEKKQRKWPDLLWDIFAIVVAIMIAAFCLSYFGRLAENLF